MLDQTKLGIIGLGKMGGNLALQAIVLRRVDHIL